VRREVPPKVPPSPRRTPTEPCKGTGARGGGRTPVNTGASGGKLVLPASVTGRVAHEGMRAGSTRGHEPPWHGWRGSGWQ
jgi:hypothetical protein